MSTPPTPRPESSPPRVWLRRGIGLGVLLVASVAAVVMVWRHLEAARVNKRIHQIQADLDATDPGWRWDDLVAKRPDPPTGKNSADVIAFVTARLPASWPGSEKFDALGHARPPHRLDPAARAALDTELKAHDVAVQAASTLATMPFGRHPLTLPNNLLLTSSDIPESTRLTAVLLRYEASRQADAGDIDAALRSCCGTVHAGRSLANDPFLISQLTCLNCVGVGANEVEVILALGEASDVALADIQSVFRTEVETNRLLLGYRGERALIHDLLTKLMDGRLPIQDALDMGVAEQLKGDWRFRVFGYGPRDVRREYSVLIEYLTRVVDIVRLPLHEQDVPFCGLDPMPPNYPLAWSLHLNPAHRVTFVARRLQARARLIHALIGVERYRLVNKRWPVRLADVSAALLPGGVSIDPFDGKPLRYRRTTDGVVVYSVGEDLKDDGGAVTDAGGRHRRPEPGADLGYRLWDIDKRRQPPLHAAPSKTEAP